MAEEAPRRKAQTLDDVAEGLESRIAARAYELYELRGREDGHDREDWIQAEQEILADRMDADEG